MKRVIGLILLFMLFAWTLAGFWFRIQVAEKAAIAKAETQQAKVVSTKPDSVKADSVNRVAPPPIQTPPSAKGGEE